MYYTDEPISKPQDDAFGRNLFVGNLANDIKKWNSDGSLVLALYGPWGSGKSSVLNLLRKQFEKHKSIKIISFDPWYFNSTEQLIQTFFSVVKKTTLESTETNIKNGLESAFQRYGAALSKHVSWDPEIELPGGVKLKLGNVEKKEHEFENPEEVRDNLRNALGKLHKKFIVLIDNLDRLDPPELLLMFKLVRLCSDFPNFVFVLAFDHKQVQKLIQKEGVDPDFLAKIVQIDIELPQIDQEQIDEFIIESLKKSLTVLKVEVNKNSFARFLSAYSQHLSGQIIDDLRKAKRYLNSISFTLALVKEDVDIADFLILEAIRVFYPKLYAGLPIRKKDLTSFDYGYGIDTLRKQRLAILQETKEWVERELPEKFDYQKCLGLIGFLFPIFGEYLTNPTNPRIVIPQDEFLATQRICLPAYFDMYFKFRVPQNEIPLKVVNTIVDSLNTEDKESVNNAIVALFSEYGRLSELIRKINFRIYDLNIDGRIKLILILGALAAKLRWELPDWTTSDGPLAARVIAKCVELSEYDNSQIKILGTVKEILQSTSSLAFMTELLVKFLPDNRHIFIPDQDARELISIAKERVQIELVEKKVNVFSEYPVAYFRILSVWKSEKMLNRRQEANEYIYEMLDKYPGTLPKLLIMFGRYPAGHTEVSQIDFTELEQQYDVDKLFSILQKQENDFAYSEYDEKIIGLFKEAMLGKEQLKKQATPTENIS